MSFETSGEDVDDEKAAQCQKLLQRCIQPTVKAEETKEPTKEEETTEAGTIQVRSNSLLKSTKFVTIPFK